MDEGEYSSGSSPDSAQQVDLTSRLMVFLSPRGRTWSLITLLNLVAFGILYLASVKMQENEILNVTSRTTREHLEHEAEELQAIALIRTGEAEGGHPFETLAPAHSMFQSQLHLASGQVISSQEGMDLISQAEMAEFLASGETARQWLSTDDGRIQMNGLKRIMATPECGPCHEIGSTRAVSVMSFDLTEIMTTARRRIRLNLALLILIWGLVLGAISALLRRSTRRSIRHLEAQLEAIESGSGDLGRFDETTPLDPVTADLHQELGDLLRRQKARRAENKNRLAHSERLAGLGRWTAALAQEIKNPLAGVQAALQVLESKNQSESNSELFHEMVKQLQSVDLTLQNLLSCAEPSPPSIAVVDLRGYFEQIADSLEPNLETQGISFEVSVPEDNHEASLDPMMIHQVIANLAENAAEAIQEGGTIRLRGGPLPTGNGTLISVEDDGPGIANDDLERVFEPFVSTKYGRSGLGLTIARSIVEQHGGTVQIESTLGEGTTFMILLPEPEEPPPEKTEDI